MKLNGEELLTPMTELLQKIGAKEKFWRPEKMELPKAELNLEVNASTDPELTAALFNRDMNGLLNINGEQVLLYIPDGVTGNLPKFHFMDCSTINKMRNDGRLERYIITNRTSGLFKMHVREEIYSSNSTEREEPLRVCKNCLKAWNYKGFSNALLTEQNNIVQSFDIAEFFASCRASFRVLPSRTDATLLTRNAYLENWDEISRAFRAGENWHCQQCGVDLREHKELLHVHHINGNKQDTRPENLKALCILCHASTPNHQHMEVFAEARAFILRRRAEAQDKVRQLEEMTLKD